MVPQSFKVVDCPEDRNAIGCGGVDRGKLLVQSAKTHTVAVMLLIERRQGIKSNSFAGSVGCGYRERVDGPLGPVYRSRECCLLFYDFAATFIDGSADTVAYRVQYFFVNRQRLKLSDDESFDFFGGQ